MDGIVKWVVYLGKQGVILDAYDQIDALLQAREMFIRLAGREVAIQELSAHRVYEMAPGVFRPCPDGST